MRIRVIWAIWHVLRISLGVIFLWASITKITDIKTFIEEVGRYRILPDTFVPAFAVFLIGIEFVASIMLLIGIRP
jgi:putative oxidoreductase